MSPIQLIFILVTVPLLFLMGVWVVVTAYRILIPEQPRPYAAHPVVLRKRAAAEGQYVPVGARDIREDQRHLSDEQGEEAYCYLHGSSAGLPDAWIEDLWHRQN